MLRFIKNLFCNDPVLLLTAAPNPDDVPSVPGSNIMSKLAFARCENRLYRAFRQGRRHILLYSESEQERRAMAQRLFCRLTPRYTRVIWLEYDGYVRNSILTQASTLPDGNEACQFGWFIEQLREHPEKTIVFINNVDSQAIDDCTLLQLTGLGVSILVTSGIPELPPYESWNLNAY